MKTLIIGNGETGNALRKVLSPHYDVAIRDIYYLYVPGIEVLHICYPYSPNFVRITLNYIDFYHPKFTVIHSTVPVGTSKKCNAFHSPIRGIHPYLEKSIKTYAKYLAPKNKKLAKYFEKTGIKITQTPKTETTELAKILSTTRYGLDIIFCKEAWKLAKEHKADFNILYTDWTKTHNEGAKKLGLEKYTRSILKYVEGKIGGHCVIQNCHLLKNWITGIIKKKNG